MAADHRQKTAVATMVVMVTVVNVATGTKGITYISVAQNMAPPPLAVTNITTVSSMAECGHLCYTATVDRCLAFVWRPNKPPSTLVVPASKSSSVKGKCELLTCLPHPASLAPYPGAHLFVVKTQNSTTPPPPQTPTMVPASYSMACTFAYHVFVTPQLGYSQAAKRCAQDGARLMVFKSSKDEAAVSGDVEITEPYWIGLTDRQTEGVFVWADQSKLSYTNWDKDQPNNFVRGKKDQDCVMLYNERWNDHQCRDALKFICQVPLLHP